jgi:glutathione S-transferase
MKLYGSPGACSLSPHIVLLEAALPFEFVTTNTKTKLLPNGGDFKTVNANGYVPVLEFDDGERLTEGPAIVQYIADQVPEKNLAPANGTRARAHLQEWLNFVTSEIHKGFSPLFSPATPEEYKVMSREKLKLRYRYVDASLAGKKFLLGDTFTVADAYLFVVTRWSSKTGVDIDGLRNLAQFMERVAARPAVKEALKAEGLQ